MVVEILQKLQILLVIGQLRELVQQLYQVLLAVVQQARNDEVDALAFGFGEELLLLVSIYKSGSEPVLEMGVHLLLREGEELESEGWLEG